MMDLTGWSIAVLMGGPGSEREVSLASGRGVAGALRFVGANVREVDVCGDDFELPDGIDIAFNVVHGTFGEDGQLQALLDARGIRYTGEGVKASRMAFDKILSKEAFVMAGVKTPRHVVRHPGEPLDFPLPCVIKAPRQGSSVGVHVVKSHDQVAAALEDVTALDADILVEEFVAGRELTVGLLGAHPLPVIEIIPNDGFYDFRNKYPFLSPGGGATHVCPAALSESERAIVQETALAAARALGIEVYGRVDILLTPEGQANVLEINTLPGMTEASLLPEAAAAAGIAYPELCVRIIELSLARYERRPEVSP